MKSEEEALIRYALKERCSKADVMLRAVRVFLGIED